jgi:hypothetical protein
MRSCGNFNKVTRVFEVGVFKQPDYFIVTTGNITIKEKQNTYH